MYFPSESVTFCIPNCKYKFSLVAFCAHARTRVCVCVCVCVCACACACAWAWACACACARVYMTLALFLFVYMFVPAGIGGRACMRAHVRARVRTSASRRNVDIIINNIHLISVDL